MFTNSWTSVQGTQEIIKTAKGAKPGDSWADEAWGIMFSQLLETLSGKLEKAGIQFRVEFESQSHILSGRGAVGESSSSPTSEVPGREVSFIDDVVIMIINIDPDQLLQDLIVAGQIVLETFEEFLLEVNWGQGKTEAVVTLRGKIVKQVKQNCLSRREVFYRSPMVREALRLSVT